MAILVSYVLPGVGESLWSPDIVQFPPLSSTPDPNYRRQPPTTPPINTLHLSTSALPAATRDLTWNKSSCCTFRFRSNSVRAKVFSSLRVGSFFARRRVVRRIVRYNDRTWARRRKAGRERGSGRRCVEFLV